MSIECLIARSVAILQLVVVSVGIQQRRDTLSATERVEMQRSRESVIDDPKRVCFVAANGVNGKHVRQ